MKLTYRISATAGTACMAPKLHFQVEYKNGVSIAAFMLRVY